MSNITEYHARDHLPGTQACLEASWQRPCNIPRAWAAVIWNNLLGQVSCGHLKAMPSSLQTEAAMLLTNTSKVVQTEAAMLLTNTSRPCLDTISQRRPNSHLLLLQGHQHSMICL